MPAFFLGKVGNQCLSRNEQRSYRCRVLQCGSDHLRRIDNAGLHQVFILAGGGVDPPLSTPLRGVLKLRCARLRRLPPGADIAVVFMVIDEVGALEAAILPGGLVEHRCVRLDALVFYRPSQVGG
jgi:hypothetical protein